MNEWGFERADKRVINRITKWLINRVTDLVIDWMAK